MTTGSKLILSLLCMVFPVVPLSAQDPTASVVGRVVDSSTLQPVADALVAVGDRRVTTNAQGRFTVPGLTPGTHVIRATNFGYAETTLSVTVAAGQTLSVDIVLAPEAIALDAIITVGYGTRRAADVTGSVAQVTQAEFNPGRVVSPEQLIQGRIAGVRVIDTGEPGGGVQMRIRGATSVTASNDPLFVVDGHPLPVGGGLSAGRNPLNFLNPEDIESITVLKDASATAIYGSRGANGVVIIQTRRGSLLEPQVSYSTSVSTSRITNRPNMLSTDQFRSVVTQHAPSMVTHLGSANTNWLDEVVRSAFGQEHTLSLAGAGSDITYRFSLNYLDQEGIVTGSSTQRASAALAYTHSLLDDRLNVRANLRGARTDDDFTPGGGVGAATIFNPTQPVRTATGFFEATAFELGPNNPVAEFTFGSNQGTTYRGIANGEAVYRLPFVDGLTGTVRGGFDVANSERREFMPSSLWGQQKRHELAGFMSRSNPRETTGVFDGFLSYARALDQWNSNLDVTAGYSWEQFRGDYPYFEASGLQTDLLGPSGLPVAQEVAPRLDVQESKLASFFARANYTLMNRYLLTLSVRRDGSSRFGPDNQWGTFPAAAVAWRVSEESFLQGNPWITDLKLRASWGVNGNQTIGNYAWAPAYRLSDQFSRVQFGDDFVTTIRPTAVDPNIKWEETTSWNVGLDYTLFGHRINGAIEYYLKDTDDLLFRVPVAAGTHVGNFLTTNIGSVRNQGVELSLSAAIMERGRTGLNYTASFTAAHNKNRLISINPFAGGSELILTGGIAGGVGSNIQVLLPGVPVNSFFVYQHRLDAQGRPVATGTPIQMYEDLNGDGRITLEDRRPFNSPDPNWVFGHTSNFGYRDITLGFSLRAHVGNYIYNNVASFSGYYNRLLEAAGPTNLHASVLENQFVAPQYFSDVYVEDASFLRMDNITLGYTLPQSRFARNMRIFGTVQNVFTITGYSGVDPEVVNISDRTLGIDNNIYPRARTFTTGISVGF